MKEQESALTESLTRFIDAVRHAETLPHGGLIAARELAGATEADVAAVVRDGRVLGMAGPRRSDVTAEAILAATTAGPAAEVVGLGRCDVAVSGAHDAAGTRLVVLRRQGAISRRQREYLDLAAVAFSLTFDLLVGMETERELLTRSLRENEEHDRLVGALLKQQQLLDNLDRIERSVSQRVPLGVVLSTITDAAYQLLGDDVVALRLLDPADPQYLLLVSEIGVKADVFNAVRRTPVGAGAGGRAVAENALVVIEDYADEPAALEDFVKSGVRAAISAPIQDNGVAVGSFTVATYDPDRHFHAVDQETLLAFAEHVSLALTEARTSVAPASVLFGVVQTIARHSALPPGDPREAMSATAKRREYGLGLLIDRLLEGGHEVFSGTVQDASLPAIIQAAVTPYADSGRHLLVPPVAPQPLRIDVTKVQGALSNLLENAIRFSPEHSPIVVETDVAAEMISVTVTAQGELPPGTTPESLFERQEPSAKEGSAHEPSPQGPRLGLYLARHLATAMGGSISVAHSAGTMSFTLQFPAGAKAASASPVKSRRRWSVLAGESDEATDRA